jgi:hypothetical protein
MLPKNLLRGNHDIIKPLVIPSNVPSERYHLTIPWNSTINEHGSFNQFYDQPYSKVSPSAAHC